MSQATQAQDAAEQERTSVEQIVASKAYVDNPELLPWYKKDLVELKPETRKVFEDYSHVPADDVVAHITKVRDEAFKTVCPQYIHFLGPMLTWPLVSIPLPWPLGLSRSQHRAIASLQRSTRPHQKRGAIPRSWVLHGPRHPKDCFRRGSFGKHLCFRH